MPKVKDNGFYEIEWKLGGYVEENNDDNFKWF